MMFLHGLSHLAFNLNYDFLKGKFRVEIKYLKNQFWKSKWFFKLWIFNQSHHDYNIPSIYQLFATKKNKIKIKQ